MGTFLLIACSLMTLLCLGSMMSLAIRGRFNKKKITAIVKQDMQKTATTFREADADRSFRNRFSKQTRWRIKATIRRHM